KLLLKMGMYLLDCSALPAYTVVSEIAETAKKVGKGAVVGFLNAVLRSYAEKGKDLYPDDPQELLSVRANLPVWLVDRYIQEWGEEEATRRLTMPRTVKTHIRPAFSLGKEGLADLLRERSVSYEETAHGFYIGAVSAVSDLLREGKATVMSYGSAEVASAVPYIGGEILDLCAAPGGKSVYLAEKYGAPVVACDLHPHRVELIEKYAARMHVTNVSPCVEDGTALRKEWIGRFDTVLLDAPCSGLGSLAANPDIAIHRNAYDMNDLSCTQYRLIETAGKYVKQYGFMEYSTCSDLPSEDGDVVRWFLDRDPSFLLQEEHYTDPAEGGGESYYYAILRKV
ncbi:MAG: hypothetical protein J5765_05370, partial [Clostridia bacterium]|nr:hypothetical protein [Clostridia bacterium]